MCKGMEVIRLIIAEDEPVQRDALLKLVKQWSPDAVIVGEVENGEEVLTLMASSRVDLVITDIKMPQTDGIELARLIKKYYPSTAIVIVSGYSEFQLAQKAIQYGVGRYILKPIKKRDLWEALSQVLRDRVRRADHTVVRPVSCRDQRIVSLLEFIHEHPDDESSLKELCKKLSIGPYETVRRVFQSELGQSFHQYRLCFKIIKAKEYLIKGNNVSETALLVGWDDVSNFVKAFKHESGLTPGIWIKQRRG